jgi:AcrR family transcriptional regulator
MSAATSARAADRSAARERLLAAADELFYEEGVRTVGIDRIIEHAGVAKATLYNTFGSKEELVRAYLSGRHARRQARVAAALARYDTPREKLLGIFLAQADLFAEPGFRGCAFVNASAEARPGSAIEEVSAETRRWLRSVLRDLAAEAGAPDPDVLAAQLHLLYDGANVRAQLDHDPGAAIPAMTAAAVLIDAALAQAAPR